MMCPKYYYTSKICCFVFLSNNKVKKTTTAIPKICYENLLLLSQSHIYIDR
jgi:hypothetical protein